MQELKVRKRDQSEEDWSYDKLLASIGKAGVEIKEAQIIASKIESWAGSSSENGIVDSEKLREKVFEVMKDTHPAEADSYQVFRKP